MTHQGGPSAAIYDARVLTVDEGLDLLCQEWRRIDNHDLGRRVDTSGVLFKSSRWREDPFNDGFYRRYFEGILGDTQYGYFAHSESRSQHLRAQAEAGAIEEVRYQLTLTKDSGPRTKDSDPGL